MQPADSKPNQPITTQQQPKDNQIGPDPRKLQKLDLHEIYLGNIPQSQSYQISYMHRDVVTNIMVSNKIDMVITISMDGHVKFWKKVFLLVEFVKNFKAHNGAITCSALNKNHDMLCTVGVDKTLKIFDVLNTDLRMIIKLPFVPSACEFLPRKGFDLSLIAISEEKSGKITIIDIEKSNQEPDAYKYDEQNNILGIGNDVGQQKQKKADKQEQKAYNFSEHVVKVLNIHKHPIRFILMNWSYNFCVSIDERAFLQVWDPATYDFPTNTAYKSKIGTQFLQLMQHNSIPIGMTLSPKGNLVGIYLKDRTIRIYNLYSGKHVVTINESIKQITKIQQEASHQRHAEQYLEQAQFQKKLNIEKDIEVSKQYLNAPRLDFDQSETFLIYPSFRGIKIYSIKRKQVEIIIGKKQHQRFIKVALYQGKVMRNPAGSASNTGQRKAADPTIYCTSFRKPRFYIFSRRNPDLGPETATIRDVINEKTIKDEHAAKDHVNKLVEKKSEVTLHTTLGDISLQLFTQNCPKTCENFIQLCRKGYYNNVIFHRVIKNFMNQTGCPKGDGTGGQSIWGGYFQDELCPEKHRFDRPYMLAMANRGPNTNGSQFFITVVATPWLDNKHTVFGRVVRGIETVCDINKLKTDKTQKPLINVKIISATIK